MNILLQQSCNTHEVLDAKVSAGHVAMLYMQASLMI